MHDLIPLARSAEYSGRRNVERDLTAVFIGLYQKMLAERAQDINVYAMPHLGSRDLIDRILKMEGVANFNTTQITDDAARYLLYAVRHRNGKRGTALLETFIRCTWGSDFRVDQLWQKKTLPYPTQLKTADEIALAGESGNDYFLTSRLLLYFGDIGKPFPTEVRNATRAVLPARLFVSEVRRMLPTAMPTIGLSAVTKLQRTMLVKATAGIDVSTNFGVAVHSLTTPIRVFGINGTAG